MKQTAAKDRPPSLDDRLERMMMRRRTIKFQLWQALAATLFLTLGIILFAGLAVKGGDKGAGLFARAVRGVVDLPLTAYRVSHEVITRYDPRRVPGRRFEGESGFEKTPAAPPTSALIALSRFDGDKKRGYVELITMEAGEKLWTYTPDLKGIYARATTPEKQSHLRQNHGPSRYLPYHPLVFADGSIVFHSMDSPLVKMDACSRIIWLLDGEYHHGIEADGEGGLWSIRTLQPPSIDYVDENYQDDAIVHVSADGEILFERSISDALIKNGYGPIVYSHDNYDPDPIHLNDVQPARADGEFWKNGDLFLSLRNPSMIVLYRPSTDKILWARQGPWLMQHDVDIINDHAIGVFNNNAVAAPDGEKVMGVNEILKYDFETGEATPLYEAGFAEEGIRTRTNGLFRILADGGVAIEEQNFGRMIGLGPDGALRWRYVNRAKKDGRVYHLGWSRVIEGAAADNVRRSLASTQCPAKSR